jgi:hypothetical protein
MLLTEHMQPWLGTHPELLNPSKHRGNGKEVSPRRVDRRTRMRLPGLAGRLPACHADDEMRRIAGAREVHFHTFILFAPRGTSQAWRHYPQEQQSPSTPAAPSARGGMRASGKPPRYAHSGGEATLVAGSVDDATCSRRIAAPTGSILPLILRQKAPWRFDLTAGFGWPLCRQSNPPCLSIPESICVTSRQQFLIRGALYLAMTAYAVP